MRNQAAFFLTYFSDRRSYLTAGTDIHIVDGRGAELAVYSLRELENSTALKGFLNNVNAFGSYVTTFQVISVRTAGRTNS